MYEGQCAHVTRVMFERCIGLCHQDDLKMKTIGTSCILCVYIHQDTSLFMMMSIDAYTMIKNGHDSHEN